MVSLGKVRESNNGPPPPQGGFGVHGCLCVKQRVSQTCVFIKLLPCSQNKDTWVHPGFCLQHTGNWSDVHRRNDGSSNEHEQSPGKWPFFLVPPNLAPGTHGPKTNMMAFKGRTGSPASPRWSRARAFNPGCITKPTEQLLKPQYLNLIKDT